MGVESSTTLSLAIGMLAIWIAVVHCHVLTLLRQGERLYQKMQDYVGVLSIIVGGLGQILFINTAKAESFAQNETVQKAAAGNVSVAMPV